MSIVRLEESKLSKYFAIVFLSLILAFSTSLQNSYAGVGDPIQLSDDDAIDSASPQIVELDGNLFVVWRDGGEILLSKISDDGVVTLDDTKIGNASSISTSPQIAEHGGSIFSVWDDATGDIRITASDDDAASFSVFDVILSSETNGLKSQFPQLGGSDSVYAVWAEEDSTNKGKILLREVGDDVGDFGTIKNVGDYSCIQPAPQVASSDGTTYVVWQSGTDLNLSIVSGGGSITTEDIGDVDSFSCMFGFPAGGPQIAVSGDNLYVVWQNGDEVWLAKSSDGGTTIAREQIGDVESTTDPATPQIAAVGTTAYAVWSDGFTSGQINLVKTTVDGANPAAETLSDSADNSVFPQIATSGETVAEASLYDTVTTSL